MKTLPAVLIVVVLAAALPAGDTPDLAAAANGSALDLYRALAAEPGNLFFSPYSVVSALAMVREGAKGETAEQMDRVLHLPGAAAAAWKAHAEALKPGVRREEGEDGPVEMPLYALSVANAVWVQDGLPLVQAFVKTLSEDYGAPPEAIDFRETDKARAAINGWVEKKTKERIKDIVPEGLPTPDTLLALANAIHFKASWDQPFDEDWTKEGEFTVAPGRTVKAPFMLRTEDWLYAETKTAQVLDMPYRGGATSMLVVLPRAPDGLDAEAAALTPETLSDLTAKMSAERVAVRFPKFTITWSTDLSETLKGIGLTAPFSADKADFTGMTTAEKLIVGPVLHKAFVAVDEAGTEAAAATVVMMLKGMAPSGKPVEFTADRPFLFLIRHVPTNTILFMGRLSDPSAK